jgi:phosphoglycolate phosphatase-like HAD superfamily hydrolase
MPTPCGEPGHTAPLLRGSAVVGWQPDEYEQQHHHPDVRRRAPALALAVAAGIIVGGVVATLAASHGALPLHQNHLAAAPRPNPPNIPPECVTALGGGVMGPGGSIHTFAGRDGSCRSALAAYAAPRTGAYWRDVEAAVAVAYGALGISSAEQSNDRPRLARARGVVIFDIDETALSNAPLSAPSSSSSSSSSSPSPPLLLTTTKPDGARAVNRRDAPALEATLRLYRALQRQGLAAAFVTGRGEADRVETERNLGSAGYGGECGGGSDARGVSSSSSSSSSYCYLSLTLRAPGDARPASVYKPEARAAVARATGLPVVGSVGDQWSDLSGGAVGGAATVVGGSGAGQGALSSSSSYVAIKLPNPFYYIL